MFDSCSYMGWGCTETKEGMIKVRRCQNCTWEDRVFVNSEGRRACMREVKWVSFKRQTKRCALDGLDPSGIKLVNRALSRVVLLVANPVLGDMTLPLQGVTLSRTKASSPCGALHLQTLRIIWAYLVPILPSFCLDIVCLLFSEWTSLPLRVQRLKAQALKSHRLGLWFWRLKSCVWP